MQIENLVDRRIDREIPEFSIIFVYAEVFLNLRLNIVPLWRAVNRNKSTKRCERHEFPSLQPVHSSTQPISLRGIKRVKQTAHWEQDCAQQFHSQGQQTRHCTFAVPGP